MVARTTRRTERMTLLARDILAYSRELHRALESGGPASRICALARPPVTAAIAALDAADLRLGKDGTLDYALSWAKINFRHIGDKISADDFGTVGDISLAYLALVASNTVSDFEDALGESGDDEDDIEPARASCGDDDTPRKSPPSPQIPLASRSAALDRALVRIGDASHGAESRRGHGDDAEFDDIRSAFEDIRGIASCAVVEDDGGCADGNCDEDRAAAGRFRVLVDAVMSIALTGIHFMRDQEGSGIQLHRDARRLLDGIEAIACDERHCFASEANSAESDDSEETGGSATDSEDPFGNLIVVAVEIEGAVRGVFPTAPETRGDLAGRLRGAFVAVRNLAETMDGCVPADDCGSYFGTPDFIRTCVRAASRAAESGLDWLGTEDYAVSVDNAVEMLFLIRRLARDAIPG